MRPPSQLDYDTVVQERDKAQAYAIGAARALTNLVKATDAFFKLGGSSDNTFHAQVIWDLRGAHNSALAWSKSVVIDDRAKDLMELREARNNAVDRARLMKENRND